MYSWSKEKEQQTIDNVYEGARSRLVAWMQYYSWLIGAVFLTITGFGLTALVEFAVERQINERTEFLKEAVQATTNATLSSIADARVKILELSKLIDQQEIERRRLSESLASMKKAEEQISSILQGDNKAALFSYLNYDFTRVKSIRTVVRICSGPGLSDAGREQIVDFSNASFDVIFLDEEPLTTIDKITGRIRKMPNIQFYPSQQGTWLNATEDESACLTTFYLPYSPFEDALIFRSIKILPRASGFRMRQNFDEVRFAQVSLVKAKAAVQIITKINVSLIVNDVSVLSIDTSPTTIGIDDSKLESEGKINIDISIDRPTRRPFELYMEAFESANFEIDDAIPPAIQK